MKTVIELNENILAITNIIREKHPELVKYLNEMPLTVPYAENPDIAFKTLNSYYSSLETLLTDTKVNYQGNKHELQEIHLPAAEIVKMELNNTYQNLFAEVNNITISYNDAGEGSVPVIFLHGYPFDKTMWHLQLDYLKSSHRVIAYDVRGFGRSTDEESPLSIDLFAKDLLLFMDKLNIKKAVLCGLSMGGFIALNAAKKNPERFEALILCDTQCIADTPEVKEKRYQTIEQIKLNGATSFNEAFVKSVFLADTLANKKELVETIRDVVFANSPAVIIAGLTALATRAETCSSLEAIHIPTLIICGREDLVTPIAQSEFMHEHIKGSSLNVIDNAGHVSNLEQPDDFNMYLHDFLYKLLSP
ncbi:MAG: alpha/beta fold hydrolase [Saprospiraceae bacterium]